MMKRFIWMCVAVFFFAACQQNGKKQPAEPTDYSMYLTKADTTIVLELVNTYMTHVKNQAYVDAAAMLFKSNSNKPHERPQLLDNDELQERIAALKAFPITDYKIESVKFDKAYNNEVRCSVVTPDGITLKWSFKPVRYVGQWALCLKDTASGDRPMK